MTQDLLDVGQRKHRKGAKKECPMVLEGGGICNELESLDHRLFLCNSVENIASIIKKVIFELIGSELDIKNILALNFKYRRKATLKITLWFIIKALFRVFNGNNRKEVLAGIISDIQWCLEN